MMIIPILLLAAFLRFYHLGSLPISLFGDELDIGYQAFSLLHTGRDYLGHLLPFYFNSLSESRMPLSVYLTTLPVALFGLNAFAVRFLPALLGVLNVFQISRLTKNKTIGLFAALMLAISPWHIHYSRAAFDVNLQLALILWGTQLLRNKNVFGFLPYALSFYAYPTSIIFVPLLSLFFIPSFLPQIKHKSTLVALSLTVILLLPFIFSLFSGSSQRFKVISIFSDPNLTNEVVLERTSPFVNQNSIVTKLFYNKVTNFAAHIGSNYLSAFSSRFLFVSGDPNYRQSVDKFGELPFFFAPLLLIGILTLLSSSKLEEEPRSGGGVLTRNEGRFFLYWLLLAPISSSLTQGGDVHVTRLYLMLPPLILFSVSGLVFALKYISKIWRPSVAYGVGGLFIIVATFYTSFYWFRYSTDYKYRSAPLWNYGYEQIMPQIRNLDLTNHRLFINNTFQPSLIAFAFYTQFDPALFQQNFQTDVPTDNVIKGFNGFKLGDNLYFGQLSPTAQLTDLLRAGDYYLAVQLKEVPGNWDYSVSPPAGIKVVSAVKNPYGDPLFYLLTRNQ